MKFIDILKLFYPNKRKVTGLFLLVIACVLQLGSMVNALSDKQKSIFGRNILYYNVACEAVAPTASDPAVGNIDSVYMVGDSITEGAKNFYHLKQKFNKKGINAHIVASGGGGIDHPGTTGSQKSGIQSVKDDGDVIKNVDAVVVALGTNDYASQLEGLLKEMVKEIKKQNSDVAIFWANTDTHSSSGLPLNGELAYTAEASMKKNEIIRKQSSLLNFNVIDIKGANVPISSDGIHPEFNDSGFGKWGDTIVKGVSSASSGSEISGNTQKLAQKILNNDNVTFWAAAPENPRSDWTSSVPAGGNKTLIDTRDVVRALAQGKEAYTTAANASNKTAQINPDILKFILAVGNQGNHIMVNALTDKTHSDGSNHYKGLAVDLDTSSAPLSVLQPIANKYGGQKNSEGGHHHFDFVNSPGADQPEEPSEPAEPNTACCPGGGASTPAEAGAGSPEGSSDAETAFIHFVQEGLSKQGAAGIVGNLMRETGGDGFNFDPSSGPPASSYYGIAQWSSSRWQGVVKLADEQNKTPQDLNVQLDYIWQEMHEDAYSSLIPKLKNATDPRQAAADFNSIFEVGADEGLRMDNAQKAYNNFKDNEISPDTPTSGPGGGSCCIDSVSIGGNSDLDKFLRVLAYQESGGDPTQPGSAGGARGKYQYIDSTWHSSASTYYPPADDYAQANQAPEPMQDAVAYLEYLTKFKQYGQDIFKLAVSHFYPAANDDPSLLDVVPPSNVITPRQYANSIKEKINSSGPWDKIPLKYANAPDFQKYLAKVGSAPVDSPDGSQTATGCESDASTGSGDVQFPVDLKWWDNHPDYFTSPHHDHPSVDIPVPRGTPVYSMTNGKVAFVDGSGCGESVFITPEGHPDVVIGYCHGILGSRKVEAGQTVKAGQRILSVDNTGSSFGDHLHIQIEVTGVLHCPQDFLKAIGEHKPVPQYSDLPTSGCTS